MRIRLIKSLNDRWVRVTIRKVSDEHGIVLPFPYVGKGQLTNPRKLEKVDSTTGKSCVTSLFDIPMEHALPDYLQYDFGLIRERIL
jgi:hypothetical protein